jgi:hypothetical protein
VEKEETVRRDNLKWNVVTRMVVLLTGASLLVACSLTDKLTGTEQPSLPAGYRQVTSSNGSFQYWIPADWTKTAMNSYEGDGTTVIEEIYPPAKLTLEYCRSFVYPLESGEKLTRYQCGIHNNGTILGCYDLVDILATPLQKEWRHTGFYFATDKGIEELALTMERQLFNETQILTIIDSIRIK